MQQAGPAGLRLHRNERVTEFAAPDYEAMIASIRPQDFVRYPDQAPVLSSLSAHLGVATENLALFAGSESAVRALFDVMVEPGDEVVCLKPSYHGYLREAFSHRAEAVTIAYSESMELDVVAVRDAVRRGPRLVLLGNPDGLGRPLPRDLVTEILALLDGTGGMLIVDEAYHHFGAPSVCELVPSHPQLTVLRTFSKAWGLAGLRCGYAIAHADTVRMLNRVRLRNEISGVTLAIVRYALDHRELLDDYTSAVVASREALAADLTASGLRVIPSLANFLLVEAPPHESAASLQSAAQEAGIAIAVPLDDFARVTIGPHELMAPVRALLLNAAARPTTRRNQKPRSTTGA